jgi:hypothetical protein
VRCAKCRHSWFQDGPELVPPAPLPPPVETRQPAVPEAPAPAPFAAREDEPPVRTAVAPPWPAAAMPPPPFPADTAMPWGQPAAEPEDDAQEDAAAPSRFAHQPPFRPRRNPARLWTIAAVIFALVALGAIAAVAKYGLPEWAPLSRSTFAAGPPDLVLEFPPNRQDRRTLPNGTEYFGVSGRISNVGKERRVVPTLLIVLRDEHNHIVYSWEVTPPKRVLAPGEALPVIEAVTDIPRAAKFAEIGWKRT